MTNEKLMLKTIADMTVLLSQLGEAQTVMADILVKTRDISDPDRQRLRATLQSIEAPLRTLGDAGRILKASL